MSRPLLSSDPDGSTSSSEDYSDAEPFEARFERSNAPSPVPGLKQTINRPTYTAGTAGRRVPAPIDTSPEEHVQYIPFNVRDFEDRNDPLMFTLEYTEMSNNYPTIRHKALIPDKYIERMYFKSPCLSHSIHVENESDLSHNAQPVNNVAEDSSDEHMDTDDFPILSSQARGTSIANLADEETSEDRSIAESIDWEQDPSYQTFLRRLDQTSHLRKHRLHPVSKYVDDEHDCQGCHILPLAEGKTRPAKKELNNKDFVALERRHLSAEVDLAEEDHWDGRECPICGDSFKSQEGEGRATIHWFNHHQSYVDQLYQELSKINNGDKGRGKALKQALKASGLTINPILEYKVLSNAHRNQNDFTCDKFHYMEQVCNRAENEILEREEFCRVCYSTFQYGDSELLAHYKQHKEQETIINILSEADEQGSPARVQALQELRAESNQKLPSVGSPEYVRLSPETQSRIDKFMAGINLQASPKPKRAEVNAEKENIRLQLRSGPPSPSGTAPTKSRSPASKTSTREKPPVDFALQDAASARAAKLAKKHHTAVGARILSAENKVHGSGLYTTTTKGNNATKSSSPKIRKRKAGDSVVYDDLTPLVVSKCRAKAKGRKSFLKVGR